MDACPPPEGRPRCEHCQAWTWCRFPGKAEDMPCDADPYSGRRPGT